MDPTTWNKESTMLRISLLASLMICLIQPVLSQEKIVIIGAGISGLAAGKSLQESGFEVVILEARDRIGGRVWTDRSTGKALDLGASWIHAITGNPITELATKINAPLSALTDYDDTSTFDADGREDPLTDAQTENFSNIFAQYAEIVTAANVNASVQDVVDEAVRQGALNDFGTRSINSIINTVKEHEYAADSSELSQIGTEEGTDMGGGDVLFPDGFDAITNFLATGLNIQLQTVAQSVTYTDTGVVVETNKGSHSANRVIVTVPLGVLKSGDITFSPALPASKLNAISALGSGVLNKVWLEFPSVFWDNTTIHNYFSMPKGHFNEWVNWHKATGNNHLLGFNAGQYGLETEALSDDDIVAEAMTILKTMWGTDIPEPTNRLITRWNSDPFARGAYSFIKVGSSIEDRAILAQSVSDRVFFAGEATDTDAAATTNGAYNSGLREAAKISSIAPAPSDNAGVFDVSTNTLVMPKLEAAGQYYKLTLLLTDPGQLIFQISGADLLQATGFSAAKFDTATNKLILPVIKVNAQKYYLEMSIVANSNPIQLTLSKAVLL